MAPSHGKSAQEYGPVITSLKVRVRFCKHHCHHHHSHPPLHKHFYLSDRMSSAVAPDPSSSSSSTTTTRSNPLNPTTPFVNLSRVPPVTGADSPDLETSLDLRETQNFSISLVERHEGQHPNGNHHHGWKQQQQHPEGYNHNSHNNQAPLNYSPDPYPDQRIPNYHYPPGNNNQGPYYPPSSSSSSSSSGQYNHHHHPYQQHQPHPYPPQGSSSSTGPGVGGYSGSTPSHPLGSGTPTNGSINGTITGNAHGGSGVIVRGEEIGIVLVVLLLWVGAIIMFFNRWGKIRMLEPYQPKFCEDHRLSCPMAEVTTVQQYPRSFSKSDLMGSPHFAKCNYHGITPGYGLGPSLGVMGANRPRQNSVFVTSPHSAAMASNSSVLQKASRKTKSAIDLSTLVLSEEFLENDEEEHDESEREKQPLATSSIEEEESISRA